MANNLLPPIPQAPISETFQWRDWLRNLGNYIAVVQVGGSPWTVVQGGTGASTASGARANLGISVVGNTGLYSDLIGRPSFATVATTGQYSDLIGKPTLGTMAAQNVGINATITTAKLTTLGAQGSMTFTNGILTAHTQAT
jgi:hypothetical protein